MAAYLTTSPTTSRDNSSATPGAVIAVIVISVGVFLLLLSYVCSRNSRANAASDADAAAAVFATLAARRRTPPPAQLPPVAWDDNDSEEQRLRSRSANDGNSGRPRLASPAAGLPSFTYNRSVRHNVKGGGGGEGAATCSVCLGTFTVGETVRLLPVCLHLYHVECIDPWLDAHSTCPICRTGIDLAVDSSLRPPV